MRSVSRIASARHACVRHYASTPIIPVMPPTTTTTSKAPRLPDAVPPMLPSDVQDPTVVTPPVHGKSSASDAVPFATQPVVLETEPIAKKTSHKLRNAFIATLLGGALIYGGGLYAALNNDTAYQLYTEFLPYGEELVLTMQEREFRSRFPGASEHKSKPSSGRSTSTNIYIPISGAQAKIRDAPQAKILQPGPQNSAIKAEDKATPGGSSDVKVTNNLPTTQADQSKAKVEVPVVASDPSPPVKSDKLPARATSAKVPAGTATSAKTGDAGLRQAPQVVEKSSPQESTPVVSTDAIAASPIPPESKPIKTFDIPQAYDRSVERLQFAINGVIKAANEYGSSPFFQASLDNAKDEVVAINKKVSEIQAEERLKGEEHLAAQAQEYSKMQQAHIDQVNKEIAAYERQLSMELDQEKQRLNKVYFERLSEEVKKVESLSEQKLQNQLMEQAIEMQRKLNREVRARVEEERGGRLGKLETLQKSIVELKQLNVDSTAFVEERVRLQDLEVALGALKSVLSESKPRPFIKELAAVKELAGQDELLRASIDSIDTESYRTGVPTSGQLADRFRAVADEVRKSALLPEGAGVAGHATSWLLSKVMFRKRGMVDGSDVEAVLARTEAHLEANDLDSAAREMNQLKGWAKVISSDWLGMARRYLEIQQSVELIEQSLILRALQSKE